MRAPGITLHLITRTPCQTQLALYSLQTDLQEECPSPTSAHSRRLPPGISQGPRKITPSLQEDCPSPTSAHSRRLTPGISQGPRKITPSPGYPYTTLQATGCFPRALLKSSRDSNVFWLVIGVLMTWRCKAEKNYNHKISKQFQ